MVASVADDSSEDFWVKQDAIEERKCRRHDMEEGMMVLLIKSEELFVK